MLTLQTKTKLNKAMAQIGKAVSLGVVLSVSMHFVTPTMGQNNSKVETEIIEFSYHGFSPHKIVRSPGPFRLAIHNTTKNALTFELVPASQALLPNGANKPEPPVKSLDLDHKTGVIVWREVLTLTPGAYTLQIKGIASPSIDIVISPTGK